MNIANIPEADLKNGVTKLASVLKLSEASVETMFKEILNLVALSSEPAEEQETETMNPAEESADIESTIQSPSLM